MMAIRTVLVTTCLNEVQNVHRWINDVSKQSLRPDEICIVDAGSTDGTLERLEAWASEDRRVKVQVVSRCNVAQGRNRAITMSSGDVIASTDMGCRLDIRWFEKLCAPFQDEETDVVAGNYSADVDTVKTSAAKAACYIFNNYRPTMGASFLPSSRSIAYRRRVWTELGGYPEDLTFAGDDTVFAMQIYRARFTIALAKEAMCFWGRHEKLRQYWKEAYVYSVGNGEAGIYTPRFMTPRNPRYSKLFAYYDALKRATVLSQRSLLEALTHRDLWAMLLIPILQFGLVTNSYRGYAVGALRGATKCCDTREVRLRTS